MEAQCCAFGTTQSVNARLTSAAFGKYMLSSAFKASMIVTLSRKGKLFNKSTVAEVGLFSATQDGTNIWAAVKAQTLPFSFC